MQVGIFGDTHDHLDNIRRAVALFNDRGCELTLFVGDLVSPIAVPPLRRLKSPLVGCFGDNEGNPIGIQSGISIVGTIEKPPRLHVAADGTRFALAHLAEQLNELGEPFDVGVFSHTHKPSIRRTADGRWLLNPGEACGWVFGKATVILFDTQGEPELVEL